MRKLWVVVVSVAVGAAAWAAPAGDKPGEVAADKLGAVAMPEFAGVTEWVHSEPIAAKDLKGKVAVVHFWTNGCINCVHNYPHYRAWQDKYKGEKSLVMVGVHTPEFDAEKDVARIKKRAADNKLTFAIAVDNASATWAAWGNRYWPCVYLVDRSGKVRHRWEGELGDAGAKKFTGLIDELLAEKP